MDACDIVDGTGSNDEAMADYLNKIVIKSRAEELVEAMYLCKTAEFQIGPYM